MSKPDWKDAPEWARFMAQNFYGEWEWFEEVPTSGDRYWFSANGGRSQDASGVEDPHWTETLEPRP